MATLAVEVSAVKGSITLTLEERHAIGKVIREMLNARLWVLENEAE